MDICLYHQTHGYYTRGVNFLPDTPRDFVTPPEVSDLFGFCVGRWVVQQWENMGRPTPFYYVEMGGGRGTLLRLVCAVLPEELRGALRVVWVETSPVLVEKQLNVAKELGLAVQSVGDLGDLGVKDCAILVMVECMDAIFCEQLRVRLGAGLGEVERLFVTHKDGLVDLGWVVEPAWEEFLPLDGWKPPALPTAGAEVVWECGAGRQAVWRQVKALGVPTLVVDYGYAQLPPHGGDSLQALHKHRKVGLLEQAGDADLTAHVNFGEGMAILGRESCQLENLADFLLRMGIVELGLQHMPRLKQGEEGLRRLLHPAEMGTLFKVLCFMPSTR